MGLWTQKLSGISTGNRDFKKELPKILGQLRGIGVVFVPIIREFLKRDEFSNYPLPVYQIKINFDLANGPTVYRGPSGIFSGNPVVKNVNLI